MTATTDYTCKCPGPFGTARYTTIDAARMMFQCRRCNTQLVPAEPISLFNEEQQFVADVADDTSNVAPGANESDDPISTLLNKEKEILRRRRAGETNAPTQPKPERPKEPTERERPEQSAANAADDGTKKPDESHDIEQHVAKFIEDPTRAGYNVPAALEVWKQLGQQFRSILAPLRVNDVDDAIPDDDEPDVRIQYAHGIVYEFDRMDLDDDDFLFKLETFADSWKARKNAILDFRARGRRYLLNAELVAGIDYRD